MYFVALEKHPFWCVTFSHVIQGNMEHEPYYLLIKPEQSRFGRTDSPDDEPQYKDRI